RFTVLLFHVPPLLIVTPPNDFAPVALVMLSVPLTVVAPVTATATAPIPNVVFVCTSSAAFTVAAAAVFVLPPLNVRLLYVSAAIVCAPPLYSTVPVLAVKVPEVPLTVLPSLSVLEPPSSVPFVRVQMPVHVWV